MSERQYTIKNNIFSSCKADQTVILKKRFLEHLPGRRWQVPPPPRYQQETDPEFFYPSVNSYYPFTEDVDAFARVNHFLGSNQSTNCLKEDVDERRFVRLNEYSEERAEQQYLGSDPLCFLILGKPGLGQEEVGRRLANYWKAVYIDPQTLIEDEVASNSRPGQCIEFNLRCGRAIGIDVLMRLLAKKIQTPEVLHRGFVCCGFPLVPNDLFEDDPISSESAVFTVQETFDELIDRTIRATDISGHVAVSMIDSKDEDGESKSVTQDFAEPASDSLIKVSLDWSVEDQVCGTPDICADLEKQLNCIFGLFRDPFMIVYFHARNSDVVTKRNQYYFDPYSKRSVDVQKIKLFYNDGTGNEELIDDLFGAGKNPFSDNPTLRHIVRMPEDLQANVNTQLDRYHREVVNALDCRILQHEQKYYIKLDGRSFISQMVDLIKLRLKLLPVQPVITPQAFATIYEETGEGAEPNQQLTVQEASLRFSTQDSPGLRFKWRWSDWGPFCPVSMLNGTYQQGSPEHAAHFTNKMYFFSDETNYRLFTQNPRSYLMPPFPKPGSNVLVFGPPVCGKSAVAKCLGYLLNSRVLTLSEMHTNYLTEAITDHKEKVRQSAMTEALEILKERRLAALRDKQERIVEWEEEATKLLARLIEVIEISAKKMSGVFSSFPVKINEEAAQELPSLDEENLIRERLASLNFPPQIDKGYCLQLLESRTFLKNHLPDDFKEGEDEIPPSPLDPFVAEYVEKKILEIQLEEIIKQVNENIYEMYTRGIKVIEQQLEYYGWIVDGMSTDLELLDQVCSDFRIHEIVILTSDREYLLDRFRQGDKRVVTYRDFRNFFLKLGERDAAWRAPSTVLTRSYMKEIAEDAISDILATCVDAETIEQEKELSAQEYKEAIEAHDDRMQQVRTFLEKNGTHPLVINVQNLSIEDVLEEVIYSIEDQYRRPASALTEADRAAEVQGFLSQLDQGGEGETDKLPADDSLAKNRPYGDTHYYDPVTFSSKFVLRRGKEDFAVKFKDKIYLCANEANMKEFIRCPRKFLIQTNPPERFPPPRICVVGPNAEMVTKVAKSLARNLGVRYINVARLIREALMLFSTTALFVESDDEEVLEALTQTSYDAFFSKVWFEEPLKSVGFALDGFPVDTPGMNNMIHAEALPDVIIHVTMSREEHVKRQLERSLDEWRQTIAKEQEEEHLLNSLIVSEWEEQRKIRYDELMEIKRQSRYAEKFSQQGDDGPVFESDTQISLDSVLDQQDHDETMPILDEELPEPVFEDKRESEEAATERLANEIENKYDKCVEHYEELKRICDSELVPFAEVDGEQDLEKLLRHVYILSNELKFRGPSFFERCYDVSLEMAEKLLATGYCFLSTFGRLCPVQYYEGYNPMHMYLGGESRDEIYPVIHRDYIYFVHGKKRRSKFYKNPLKYVSQKNYNFPLIPMRVAVIGPPKSGKSALAERFKRDLGFRVVSRGQAVRHVLSNPMFTNLVDIVEGVLRKGEELSDEIVMECVLAASFCGECLTRGLVFDGFPNTMSEMTALSRLGLVPHLMFDLQVSDEELWKHVATPNYTHPQYSQRYTEHLFDEWSKSQGFFRKWCDREYQNISRLPINRCIWGVWEKAKELTFSVVFERKHYYKHANSERALRLANMLVTPLEFLERQSSYRTYCPGCLYYSRRIFNGGDPPDRTGLVQLGKYFYWLCENHIDHFLKTPIQFLPPSNVPLPDELPTIIQLSEDPPSVKEDGYCVVCMKDNFPRKVLRKGLLNHAVVYKGQYFKFDTLAHLTHFMEHPQLLSDVTMQFKGDCTHAEGDSLQYRGLPVLGMLEQYVAGAVVKAVTNVVTYRPIIPGLTISQAALILVGLNLKTHNPKTEHPEMYKQGLDDFHERRLRFLKHLDLMKRYLNPCVHYEEPDAPAVDEIEIDEDEQRLYSKTYSPVR